MRNNSQWRPSEYRHRAHLQYGRHKLKSVGWTTPEEARTIDKCYNHWNYNDIRRRRPNWRLEKDLLNKFIGRPYTDFLKAWHIRTKILRRQGVPMELVYIREEPTEEPGSGDMFYVDPAGIIRRNNKYPCWQHGKRPIKIIEREVVKYHLKSEIYNDSWQVTPFRMILPILRRYFSVTDYNDIIRGNIYQDRFDKLVENSTYSGINIAIDMFARKYNNRLQEINPRAYKYRHNWCYYCYFKDLFDKDYSESIYRYIYPGTPEYDRIMAERRDARRKAIREYKRENEEYLSNLLGSIDADRKSREAQENSTRIAKHGFDGNESFRGDEYHGQKRKKHKNQQ